MLPRQPSNTAPRRSTLDRRRFSFRPPFLRRESGEPLTTTTATPTRRTFWSTDTALRHSSSPSSQRRWRGRVGSSLLSARRNWTCCSVRLSSNSPSKSTGMPVRSLAAPYFDMYLSISTPTMHFQTCCQTSQSYLWPRRRTSPAVQGYRDFTDHHPDTSPRHSFVFPRSQHHPRCPRRRRGAQERARAAAHISSTRQDGRAV